MPDFVLEVASESTAHQDSGPKQADYQALGIAEYGVSIRPENTMGTGWRMAGTNRLRLRNWRMACYRSTAPRSTCSFAGSGGNSVGATRRQDGTSQRSTTTGTRQTEPRPASANWKRKISGWAAGERSTTVMELVARSVSCAGVPAQLRMCHTAAESIRSESYKGTSKPAISDVSADVAIAPENRLLRTRQAHD